MPNHRLAWNPVLQRVLRDITAARPPLIGISGAQGSGKSTLAALLEASLSEAGIVAKVVSLDDFYLTKSERKKLSNSTHPLCQTRGVPGTHGVLAGDRMGVAVPGVGLVDPGAGARDWQGCEW